MNYTGQQSIRTPTHEPSNIIESLEARKNKYKQEYLRYKEECAKNHTQIESLKKNCGHLASDVSKMQVMLTEKEDKIRELEEHVKLIIDQSLDGTNKELKVLKDKLVEKNALNEKLLTENHRLAKVLEDEKQSMKDKIIKLEKENEDNIKQILDDSSMAIESAKKSSKEKFDKQYQDLKKFVDRIEEENKDLKLERSQMHEYIKALQQELVIKEKKDKLQLQIEQGELDSAYEQLRILNEKVKKFEEEKIWYEEEHRRLVKQCDEQVTIHVDELIEEQISLKIK